MRRLALIVLCIAAPHTAVAAPITWEAFGSVAIVSHVTVPYYLQLRFDPDLSVHAPEWPAGSPCSITPVSGVFSLGSADYPLADSYVFTNALLPITSCTSVPSGTIDFFLFLSHPEAGDSYGLLGSHFLLASYIDLLHRDGTLPTTPVYSQPGFLVYRSDHLRFGGDFSPGAVEQPVPVPEPGTMVLVSMGLAWIARQRWSAARPPAKDANQH